MVPQGEPPELSNSRTTRISFSERFSEPRILPAGEHGCGQAAAELGEEVQEAVSRFPDHSDKCTPEEEAAWRARPVFEVSVEERAIEKATAAARL